MNNWFTVEKIDSATFAISEWKHWEKAHSYLVIGNKRAVLIDTGLGVCNIGKMVSALTALPVFVVTTHVHWDHIGGHQYFDSIMVHEKEKKWLSEGFPVPLSVVKSNLLKEPCDFPPEFDPSRYTVFQGEPSAILHDGDILDLGNRRLRIIYTPGHSPGHICFYEEETGYLFSGDLIYKGTLDAFYPSTNPIEFMESVKKVESLPVSRILPGHYSLDLSSSIIKRIGSAFSQLYVQGKLKQGNGVFQFDEFGIHV